VSIHVALLVYISPRTSPRLHLRCLRGCWALAADQKKPVLCCSGPDLLWRAHVKLMTKGQAWSETFLEFLGGKCKELLLLVLCALLFKG